MESCKATIRNAVSMALGSVAESLIEEIINNVVEIGVESVEDLKLLTEKDLVPLLKPIQARKLLLILQKGMKLSIFSIFLDFLK